MGQRPTGFGNFGSVQTTNAGAGGGRAPRMTAKRQQMISEARSLLQRKEDANAARILETLITNGKDDPEALFLLAVIAERRRDVPRAISLAKRSIKQFEHVDALMLKGRCERIGGYTDDAVETCKRVLELQPGNIAAKVTMGGAMEEGGRFDESRAVIEPLWKSFLDRGEQPPASVRFEWAKLLVQAKNYGQAIDEINSFVNDPGIDESLKRISLHVLAKAHDRNKGYADAVSSAKAANEIGELEFDPDLYEQQVSTLIEIWSKERMDRFPISSCESELPVFVAGMPRSGTSLIDQIVDAHPKAAGVGELAFIEVFAKQLSKAFDGDKEPPACFGKYDAFRWTRVANDYVKDLKGRAPAGAERVVNKALGNNKLVGLIARLFPKTRIIHAIRDPRDVSISCFMGGFNNIVHPWTTRFEWIASAWAQSRRMMQHWKDTLDVPILDVHYENLVENPEYEFPRLIEFLGLEWDDRCFEFHKSRRTVRTLSYDQVNRPLYKTSSGRHKNYEAQIAGVTFPDYQR